MSNLFESNQFPAREAVQTAPNLSKDGMWIKEGISNAQGNLMHSDFP